MLHLIMFAYSVVALYYAYLFGFEAGRERKPIDELERLFWR